MQAFVDYHAMMDLTENLIRSCAKAAFPDGISSLPYQEHTLDLDSPFRKASMQELVQEATGMQFSPLSAFAHLRGSYIPSCSLAWMHCMPPLGAEVQPAETFKG